MRNSNLLTNASMYCVPEYICVWDAADVTHKEQINSHTEGKQHVGYLKIRAYIEEFQVQCTHMLPVWYSCEHVV
jgi:hypothetical protein